MSWSSAARRTARQSSSATCPSSPRSSSVPQGPPGEVVRAERVLEPGVGGAGIDEEGVTELPDVAEALERRRVQGLERRRVEPDVVPERVADDLELGGLPPSRRAHSAGPAPATVAGTCIRTSRSSPGTCRRASSPARRTRPDRPRCRAGDSTSAGTPGTEVGTSKPKTGSFTYLRSVELAGERGADHRARVRQLHALAGAVGAAGPAGVHQPDPRAVLRDLLAEHLGVHAGWQRQERRAEAGRERRARLGDAALGARDLGRVARRGSGTSPARRVSRAIGGSTPNASAVRNTMFFGMAAGAGRDDGSGCSRSGRRRACSR